MRITIPRLLQDKLGKDYRLKYVGRYNLYKKELRIFLGIRYSKWAYKGYCDFIGDILTFCSPDRELCELIDSLQIPDLKVVLTNE